MKKLDLEDDVNESSEYDSSSEDGEEQLNVIRRPIFIKSGLRKTKEEKVKNINFNISRRQRA